MALLLLLQVLSSLLFFANGASSRSTPYLSSNNCMPRLRPIGLSCFVSGSRRRRALCITLANAQDGNQQRQITNVAIVGGGLAGLSTAWHLLELSSNPLRVTIYDKCAVGKGGASAVAGG
jgi:NADPH-dependent 2,4-dienoyl-CoA reductase/sulfur reductase-like enzyme